MADNPSCEKFCYVSPIKCPKVWTRITNTETAPKKYEMDKVALQETKWSHTGKIITKDYVDVTKVDTIEV